MFMHVDTHVYAHVYTHVLTVGRAVPHTCRAAASDGDETNELPVRMREVGRVRWARIAVRDPAGLEQAINSYGTLVTISY